MRRRRRPAPVALPCPDEVDVVFTGPMFDDPLTPEQTRSLTDPSEFCARLANSLRNETPS